MSENIIQKIGFRIHLYLKRITFVLALNCIDNNKITYYQLFNNTL